MAKASRVDRPYRAMPDRGTVEDTRRALDRTNERIDRLLARIKTLEQGGAGVHNDLLGRGDPDTHPLASITGLTDAGSGDLYLADNGIYKDPDHMQWKGQWVPGAYHKNWVVIRHGVLLIANKTTTEEALTESDDWDFLSFTINQSALGGAPANFSPGASYTAVQNWSEAYAIGFFSTVPPDTATGTHMLPLTGEYRVNIQLVFQQGNDNKELAILLWVRSSIAGDFVGDAMQVSDDKTNWRAVGANFGYAGTAGETLQVGLSRVNQSLGTCSFQPSTFDVDLLIPADTSEYGD